MKNQPIEAKWELIERALYAGSTYRMPVAGGWIVRFSEYSSETSGMIGITFVPDPNHTWEVIPHIEKFPEPEREPEPDKTFKPPRKGMDDFIF